MSKLPVTVSKILGVGCVVGLILLSSWLVWGQEIDIQTIIQIESDGDPNAVSSAGCIGLMQINPNGALADWNKIMEKEHLKRFKEIVEREFGKSDNFLYMTDQLDRNFPQHTIDDLYNPSINVKVGTWYIKIQLTKYLKYYKIPLTVDNYLISYHDGINNLRKYLAGKRKLGKNMKAYLKKYHKLTEKK